MPLSRLIGDLGLALQTIRPPRRILKEGRGPWLGATVGNGTTNSFWTVLSAGTQLPVTHKAQFCDDFRQERSELGFFSYSLSYLDPDFPDEARPLVEIEVPRLRSVPPESEPIGLVVAIDCDGRVSASARDETDGTDIAVNLRQIRTVPVDQSRASTTEPPLVSYRLGNPVLSTIALLVAVLCGLPVVTSVLLGLSNDWVTWLVYVAIFLVGLGVLSSLRVYGQARVLAVFSDRIELQNESAPPEVLSFRGLVVRIERAAQTLTFFHLLPLATIERRQLVLEQGKTSITLQEQLFPDPDCLAQLCREIDRTRFHPQSAPPSGDGFAEVDTTINRDESGEYLRRLQAELAELD